MSMNLNNIGIIGFGRAGNLIYNIFGKKTRLFDSKIRRVLKVKPKSYQNILSILVRKSDLIFISTPDDKIKGVIKKIISLNLKIKGKLFLHLSGILDSSILMPLYKLGALTGAVHPAISIVDVEWILKNKDNFIWTIEAEKKVRTQVRRLFLKNGIKISPIRKEAKLTYHLGCVFLSNLPVFNPVYGGVILRETGLPEPIIKKISSGLLSCLEHNIIYIGGRESITGPIMRGDIRTIEMHLEYLKDRKEMHDWYLKKCREASRKYNIKKLESL